ncbi:MAG: DUF1566 domain-containing protein [Gammaproteobacteria bacterium]|nr:DUF1566 domain-containing protein [Gammaproteobacteria bacterium]
MISEKFTPSLALIILGLSAAGCSNSSDGGDSNNTNTPNNGSTASQTTDTSLSDDSANNATNISDSTDTSNLSFPIVDTNQKLCYNSDSSISCPASKESYFGQDAQYSNNSPSYRNNGNGTLTDLVTGLLWQKSPDISNDGTINNADKLSYSDANSYCDSLTLGGSSDWRLPTIKQAYSLIDFNGEDPSGVEGNDTSGLTPFIDTTYFDFAYGDTDAGQRIIDAQYASSTRYVTTTMNGDETMFGVNFADGRIKGYGMSLNGTDKTFYVRCVRGNSSYGENLLTANGDGTVSDAATGLMWSVSDSGYGMNWESALAWVATKNSESYLGYNDWRLPNIKELQGLVDYTVSPATDNGRAAISTLFTVTTITNEAEESDAPYYWSSTTHANANGKGTNGAYISFGRAMGYMNGSWIDVHGAGAQRSDPKRGSASEYPTGHGPQGDAIRIENYVRLVRG